MKRVMFYLLASCMLLAVSSCELVSEPDGLVQEELNGDTNSPGDGGDVVNQPDP